MRTTWPPVCLPECDAGCCFGGNIGPKKRTTTALQARYLLWSPQKSSKAIDRGGGTLGKKVLAVAWVLTSDFVHWAAEQKWAGSHIRGKIAPAFSQPSKQCCICLEFWVAFVCLVNLSSITATSLRKKNRLEGNFWMTCKVGVQSDPLIGSTVLSGNQYLDWTFIRLWFTKRVRYKMGFAQSLTYNRIDPLSGDALSGLDCRTRLLLRWREPRRSVLLWPSFVKFHQKRGGDAQILDRGETRCGAN